MGLSAGELRTDGSFERLYRRHRREVYGAVLRDVRDPDEAEDVTQIAFLNAFQAMQNGEEPDKPRAWLVTIARNVIRRRYRELARRPREVALDPEVAAALMEVDGPTAGEITATIRRLPPNQRAVILLREIQGRSYSEIAAELGLSLAAVETLIFRARRGLSEELRLADHVPTTQGRRARGLFFLPVPGLGKLSLGFSAGRMVAAAVLGSVAMVAVPAMDSGADPVRPPAAQGGPALAEETGPNAPGATRFAPSSKEGREPKQRRPQGKHDRTNAKRGAGTIQSVVGGAASAPAVPAAPVTLPSTGDVGASAPALPADSPALPVKPPSLPADSSPLPSAPTLSTPTLSTPTLSTPTLSTPTLSTPTLTTPTLTTPTLTTPSLLGG